MGWERVNLPLESNGFVPTMWQDQHSESAIAPINIEIKSGDLLAAPTVIDESTVLLDADHLASVGDVIIIQESSRLYWTTILDFASGVNEPTLDSPLDNAFSTDAVVHIGDRNLNKAGSLAVPVKAHIGPIAGVKWDITRVHVSLYDDGVMDSGKFGTITGLTNGVVLRQVNGNLKNIGNVKTNGDLTFLSSVHDYDPKAPAGFASLSADFVFGGPSHVGSVIRLNGDDSDILEVIIQDDLTGVLSVRIIPIGHVVTD